jgi:hypothetical protein
MAEKADLANRYFQASMRIYRQTRVDAKKIIEKAKTDGYESLVIVGDGDIAEICELTCLELGMRSAKASAINHELPSIRIDGLRLEAIWPEPKLMDYQD